MRWLTLLLVMTTPVLAQTAAERIEPRLTQAIEEHRIFLICSSLDPELHESVASGWRQMIGRARAYLTDHYASLAELDAFDRRTSEDVIVDRKTSLGEAIDLCTHKSAKWLDDYHFLKFTVDIAGKPGSAN